jgi:hypothetical protein
MMLDIHIRVVKSHAEERQQGLDREDHACRNGYVPENLFET